MTQTPPNSVNKNLSKAPCTAGIGPISAETPGEFYGVEFSSRRRNVGTAPSSVDSNSEVDDVLSTVRTPVDVAELGAV